MWKQSIAKTNHTCHLWCLEKFWWSKIFANRQETSQKDLYRSNHLKFKIWQHGNLYILKYPILVIYIYVPLCWSSNIFYLKIRCCSISQFCSCKLCILVYQMSELCMQLRRKLKIDNVTLMSNLTSLLFRGYIR